MLLTSLIPCSDKFQQFQGASDQFINSGLAVLAAVRGLFFAVFTAIFWTPPVEVSPGSQRFFFGPSMAHSCWSSRARGWRGTLGV